MKFRKGVRQQGQQQGPQKGQGKWKQFRKEKDGTFTVGAYKGVPNIRAKEITEFLPEGAFLGPNAENREMFNNLITQAINNIWMYRASYQLGDDDLITPEIKNSPAYQQTVLDMQTVYNELLQFMDAYATPFFSPRYQAHMLGENPLASMIGYFSSMLHNPNNVTIEAATSTVPLEMLVGDDLCKMIGYMGEGELQPFCHLNSGGSLCVIEALWSSRELKHFPLAVRKALRKSVEGSPEYDPEYKPLNAAYNVTVQPCNPAQDPVPVLTGRKPAWARLSATWI